MSRVRARWAAAKETTAGQYALRVVFGGAVTAAVGWVAHRFGPVVGGLFLAFPSLLPASLTLTAKHKGRPKAVEDAMGAIAGSVGLAAFGAVVWLAPAAWSPVLVLALASLAWLVTSTALWRMLFS